VLDQSLQLHRKHDHWQIEQMQAAQHGEGRFIVQLADVPIIVFKNKLAGKNMLCGKSERIFSARFVSSSTGSMPNATYVLAACIDIRKDIRGEVTWHLMYQWSEWLVFVSALDQNANAPSMKDSAAFGANDDV
jgi:hypothetical protein